MTHLVFGIVFPFFFWGVPGARCHFLPVSLPACDGGLRSSIPCAFFLHNFFDTAGLGNLFSTHRSFSPDVRRTQHGSRSLARSSKKQPSTYSDEKEFPLGYATFYPQRPSPVSLSGRVIVHFPILLNGDVFYSTPPNRGL